MTKLPPPSEKERQGHAHFAQGEFALAETSFRSLIAEDPLSATAHYNLGVALGKQDRIENALNSYRQALNINPHFADAYINFGTCLNELNLVEQARQCYALARQIIPDSPVPIINEAITALTLGDYEAGWKDFTARWRLPAYAKFKRNFPKPYWQGEDIGGQRLFIFAEQGFGDTFQMARFIAFLEAQGVTVIVECQPAATRLVKSVCASEVISKGEAVPAFDTYCSMMDLPGACGTRLNTIPSDMPYLFADDADVAFFSRLSPDRGLRRIGLCWAGSVAHENDANRSLRLADLQGWFAQEGNEWVCLQRLVPDRDAETLSNRPMQNLNEHLIDFAATAALIMTLDLVITVDTAIAHLAGALGKPVLVLLPFFADWRWLMRRADSPWYPTARLFRQVKRRDWSGVIAQIEAIL